MTDFDVGIKVSQLGFDAPDTGDQNLLMSSGWPLLKIEHTDTLTLDGFVSTTIYNHNLQYPPFFLIFQYNDDSLVPLHSSPGATLLKGPRQRQADPRFYVTDTKLAIEGAGDGTLPPIKIRYYICRLPLNQPFQAPIYSLSNDNSAKRDNDIGIKILKEGKESTSNDLRDYTLHSGTRSPQVHNITTAPLQKFGTNNYQLTWTNDLDYFPLYFAFQRNDTVFPEDVGRWYGPVNIAPYTQGVSSNLTAFDISDQSYASIIVFKDPFLFPNSQQVTY